MEYDILTLEQHCSNKSVGLFLECILVHFLTAGCKSLILTSRDVCRGSNKSSFIRQLYFLAFLEPGITSIANIHSKLPPFYITLYVCY